MNTQAYKTELNWTQENRKFLPWIFGVYFLVILFEIAICILNNYGLETIFHKAFMVGNLNIIIIPFAAVNGVFLLKRVFNKYTLASKTIIFLKVVGLILGVIVGTAIMEYISALTGEVDNDDFMVFGEYTLSAMTTNFIENNVIALLIGLPIFYKESLSDKLNITLKEKEKELEKVYQLKAKSELDAIHAKINPHFLYNALNSIVSLIHEDPDKAEQMVFSLSDLFRYSINSGNDNFSSIEEEIYLVRTYLEIEHVRFQDQLTFDIHVDKGLNHVMIPKFLIQPLIENAIKHGTSKINQGEINLEIRRMEEDLCISVSDNGADFPTELNSGYGLKSTVDKLELLYKSDYQFQLLNEPKKQVQIILKNIFQDENDA